jgi:hypothetical protein
MEENSKLTSCPDCGYRISRMAKTCPNCGRSLTYEDRHDGKHWRIDLRTFVFALVFTVFLGGLLTWILGWYGFMVMSFTIIVIIFMGISELFNKNKEHVS